MKDSFDHCQDPEAIAELVVKILKDPTSHLRYQTNDFSRSLAQGIFKNATGQDALIAKRTALQPMLMLLDQ